MAVDASPDTYDALVSEGAVLVDFWGPRCEPCLALMPMVEELEQRFSDRLRLVKVDATKNREVCRRLRVMGLPTYIFYRDGTEAARLSGNPVPEQIEAAVVELVEGGV
jgi:thioredoxin 1